MSDRHDHQEDRPSLRAGDTDGPLHISRLLAIRALHAGVDAAHDGRPVTDCPYSPNGTMEEQFATLWWVKGWRRGQPDRADPGGC